MTICPSPGENPQKSSLKSLKTVSKSQSLGRASNKISYLPNRAAYVVLDIIENFTMKNGYLRRTGLSFKSFNVRIKINKYANFEKSP